MFSSKPGFSWKLYSFRNNRTHFQCNKRCHRHMCMCDAFRNVFGLKMCCASQFLKKTASLCENQLSFQHWTFWIYNLDLSLWVWPSVSLAMQTLWICNSLCDFLWTRSVSFLGRCPCWKYPCPPNLSPLVTVGGIDLCVLGPPPGHCGGGHWPVCTFFPSTWPGVSLGGGSLGGRTSSLQCNELLLVFFILTSLIPLFLHDFKSKYLL